MQEEYKLVLWFKDVGIKDVALVGGKNASLGEMIQNLASQGIAIPGGFIVTAAAYRHFLKETGLEQFIRQALAGLNTKNIKDLEKRAKIIRQAINKAALPNDLKESICQAYCQMEENYTKNVDVAVRSSATAEDLPGASFAGEQETYLNIRGEKELLVAIKATMASLFTARAISYRVDKGFDHFKVALSVGVEKMVRSDLGASGVMFTLDTESGFKDIILINGSWGLGEMIVQGEVIPDEFIVFKKNLGQSPKPIIDKRIGDKNRKMIYAAGSGIKRTKILKTSSKERESFVLSDAEILKLATWGAMIETYYTQTSGHWSPMDIEWAKDGKTEELFIVQARPETVHAQRDFSKFSEYKRETEGKVIVKGASVGSKIAAGKARVILNVKGINKFQAGEVLVTRMTDPDWEPIMKIASAIVTDQGGRTSHAAIVSRELGIPCVVGTQDATQKIKTGRVITVDTTASEGIIFEGALKFSVSQIDVKTLPRPKTKIMVNIATPETAFEKSFLPVDGVGLAREEFIIASDIGIHPLALINLKQTFRDKKLAKEIIKKTRGWGNKIEFYVDKLAFGIAKIAAAFSPRPVIVRFSDFKTNEYRSLIGGEVYEPLEENPMIGWRGASRYYHPNFAPAFALECQAIKKVREVFGLINVIPMIPFCRTIQEAKKVLAIMESNGLSRGTDKELKVYMMAEIPANVVLADKFLELFDGLSIGSNDLTQLTVGIDRDSGQLVRSIANENDESVKDFIRHVIRKCKEKDKYSGICGQAPSDLPGFAEFLVGEGIESISLNPDVIVKTILRIYEYENK